MISAYPIRILILHLLTATVLLGQSLSEDSLRFAEYWSLVESGDSLSARQHLLETGRNGGIRTEQLANFLLASRAFEAGDDEAVPIYLELGVPGELSDHARWLRASALERAGQTSLAARHWATVSADESSIYRGEALLKLAERARENGDLDSLFVLVSEHSRVSRDTDAIQHLELITAEILSDLKRHEEAVNRFWGVYISSPTSDDGKRAHYLLRRYRKNHGFFPREQTAAELELELDRLASSNHLSYGLKRIRETLDEPFWREQRSMLLYYKGRFQNGLRHHRDALEILLPYIEEYPDSPYRRDVLYFLARSAYLRDRDSLSIAMIEALEKNHPGYRRTGEALKLLGILHLDRSRPRAASDAFRRWREFSRGKKSEPESLWRLGRSCWEEQEYGHAASAFIELAERFPKSSYRPVVLYWGSRAAMKHNQPDLADSLCRVLHERFPWSYYTVLAEGQCESGSPVDVRDLNPLALDSLWTSGGEHARKLSLLSAIRLPKLALLEWEAASLEMRSSNVLYWWKTQLHLWNGDRLAAWRAIRANLAGFIITEGARPIDFTRVVYPLDFDPRIIQLAKSYDLDPYFIFALICQESHFEEKIESHAGAIGLMQLMPATARSQAAKMGTKFSTRDLYVADKNLRLGIDHLAELFDEFSGDTVLVLAAYNAGKSVAQAWFEEFGDLERDDFIEHIPYRETRLFVKNIIEHTAAYRRLYPDLLTKAEPENSPEPTEN